jgi:hypothetical protein
MFMNVLVLHHLYFITSIVLLSLLGRGDSSVT